MPKDRLNALLVGHSEKPATFFRVGVNSESAEALEYTKESIDSYLKTASVDHYAITQQSDTLTVYCGAGASSLHRLIRASKQASDKEMGEALGYPKSAVDAYCREVNPRRANPDFFDELIAARNADLKIPEWIGYISHLPSICDLVTGRVCAESETLGAHITKRLPLLLTHKLLDCATLLPNRWFPPQVSPIKVVRVTIAGTKSSNWADNRSFYGKTRCQRTQCIFLSFQSRSHSRSNSPRSQLSFLIHDIGGKFPANQHHIRYKSFYHQKLRGSKIELPWHEATENQAWDMENKFCTTYLT